MRRSDAERDEDDASPREAPLRAAGDDDDFAGAAGDHLGQDGPAGVHDAEHVGFEGFAPGAGIGIVHEADGPLDAGGADEDIDRAPVDAHAIDGGGDLIGIADVSAEAHGDTAGLFDFQLGQIEFTATAGEQPDFRTARCHSEGKAFSDPPARSGDQNIFSSNNLRIRHSMSEPSETWRGRGYIPSLPF